MLPRVILSALIAVVCAAGSIKWWLDLRAINDERIAEIAEAESYAARSELVWDIETLLAALRNVQSYWAVYATLPPSEWPSSSALKLDQFDGIELILWSHPQSGSRFLYSPENGRMDYRPDDEEWGKYGLLLSAVEAGEGNRILDPVASDEQPNRIPIVLAGPDGGRDGLLVAVVDTQKALRRFLEDQSPGFAIRVEWKGTVLFERNEPDNAAPEKWVRSGRIMPSFGGLWTVIHAPTTAWIDSFAVAEVDLVLVLGLVLSVLLAALVFENRRATSRAMAAEEAERRLSTINTNLENVVRERTQELARQTADLQTLADSVGHDLRNPLNILSLNIGLLEAELGPSANDRCRDVLNRFSPAVRQMSEILERLAGLSRLSYMTFEREEFSMEQLAMETFADLAASEPQPPVKLETADLPPACADRTFTQLLLTNLFSNALKYTRNNATRRIRFDAYRENGEVVYRVSDNGPGFDDDVAEKLFAAFRRFDDDTEGLGLGLTLVKRAVDRHGGRVWAFGSKGQGATFCFTLEPANGGAVESQESLESTCQ